MNACRQKKGEVAADSVMMQELRCPPKDKLGFSTRTNKKYYLLRTGFFEMHFPVPFLPPNLSYALSPTDKKILKTRIPENVPRTSSLRCGYKSKIIETVMSVEKRTGIFSSDRCRLKKCLYCLIAESLCGVPSFMVLMPSSLFVLLKSQNL